MFAYLSFFWFFRTIKFVLFYIYLWQLKDYHIGRFLDHFRTEKGKRLFFNRVNFIKAVIFAGFLFFLLMGDRFSGENLLKFLLWLLLFLYVFESLVAVKNFITGKLKYPIFTKKAAFLTGGVLLLEMIILLIIFSMVENIFCFAFWLLFFDLFLPLVVSIAVQSCQPFTVFWRKKIIEKAKEKRTRFPKLIAIGITGSYGKTSVKNFLSQILSQKFNVLRTKEHQNSEIAISRCVLDNLKQEHEIFVAEMGSYGKGGIKLLCDIAQPKIGVITGVNEQHLALFRSMPNLLMAEGGRELIDSLPKDGFAVFSGNNKYCLELYKTINLKKFLCSISRNVEDPLLKPDFWAEDIKVEKKSVSFRALAKNGENADFKVNVIGGYNVSALLLSIAVAKELGMTLQEISEACLRISPEQGALKIIKGKEGLTIVDASYSANPSGVKAGLDYLKIYPGRKIIVMPCLIELGQASKEVHKDIGKKIGEVCDLAIITTKERFQEIKEGAKESGMKEGSVVFIENPNEILTRLNIFCNPDDVVLFEGRTPKEIIENLKEGAELKI